MKNKLRRTLTFDFQLGPSSERVYTLVSLPFFPIQKLSIAFWLLSKALSRTISFLNYPICTQRPCTIYSQHCLQSYYLSLPWRMLGSGLRVRFCTSLLDKEAMRHRQWRKESLESTYVWFPAWCQLRTSTTVVVLHCLPEQKPSSPKRNRAVGQLLKLNPFSKHAWKLLGFSDREIFIFMGEAWICRR